MGKNGVKSYVVIGALIIILVSLMFCINSNNKKSAKLDQQIRAVYVPEKQRFIKRITPEEVESKKNIVDEAIRSMLRGSPREDYSTEEGDRFLKGLFIVTSQKAPDDQSSMEEKQDFFKPFNYKLSNVGVSATGNDSFRLIADLEVTHEGKKVFSRLVTINVKGNKVEGGALYAARAGYVEE